MKTPVLVFMVAALMSTPGAASASCVPQTDAEQRARAQIVVEGIIMPPDASGQTRVSVERYEKGSGPPEVVLIGPGGAGVASSVDISPQAGERWLLLGTLDQDGALLTTACDGSAPIAAGNPDTSGPSANLAKQSGPPEPLLTLSSGDNGDGLPVWAIVALSGVPVAAVVALLARRRRRPA